jgi:hypothetical protein
VVGKPYARTIRLSLVAQECWAEIEGYASLHGGNLLDLPPARFYNAIYAWCIARLVLTGGDRDQFDFMLDAPIPGVDDQTAAPAELQSFAAFAAAVGGR